MTRPHASPHLSFVAWLLVAGVCGILLLIASFTIVVPGQQAPVDIYDRGIEGGPDSYFHHIYDPHHLLGLLGSIDLELDTFQRLSGNAILFAAFPSMPSEDPDFTMRLAETWAPGRKSDDRAVIIFLFMKEKKIRVEVGYGYEDVLTDIAAKHLIESNMVPLLQSGQTTEAIETVARALQASLSGKSGAHRERIAFRDELPGFLAEMKRRAVLLMKIWLNAEPLLRMLLGSIVLCVVVAAVWLFAGLALATRQLAIFGYRAVVQHDLSGAKEALLGVAAPLIATAKAALAIFIFGTIGEYFRSGTGMFGGAGVNVFW